MSLGFPLGLLALLGIVPLVAAYFLRRKQKPRTVSALFLWRSPDLRAEAGPRLQRFSRELSLLLEVLALAAAALYLADVRFGADAPRRHVAVVVDGGLSMSARSGGTLVADRVRDALARLVRDEQAVALTALISGQVDVEFAGPGVAKSLMDGGKIKVLAVASPHRLPLLPQVPTIEEAGVPGFELSGWYAILAPAKTPPEIVERLTAEIKKAVANPRFAKRMQDQGLEVIGSTPAEMLAAMRADTQKWKHIIDLTGTKVVQ
jgi:hypothetical protein